MSTFSKGDRVRCIKSSPDAPRAITAGDQYTVDDVSGESLVDGRTGKYILPREVDQWFLAADFEKVEPEWVVGQQVSGDDYDRLPVGATAVDRDGDGITKTEGDPILWKTDAGKICWPLHPRTLTHLPEAPEPEDTDDVEPEPLKEEGDGWSMLARQVGKASHYRFTDRGRVIFDGMAVVEKDGDGFTLTPWIEEPMRLGAVVEADVPPDLATAFVRTGLDESHPWCMSTTRAYYSWSELKNPRVLSEGLTKGGAS